MRNVKGIIVDNEPLEFPDPLSVLRIIVWEARVLIVPVDCCGSISTLLSRFEIVVAFDTGLEVEELLNIALGVVYVSITVVVLTIVTV